MAGLLREWMALMNSLEECALDPAPNYVAEKIIFWFENNRKILKISAHLGYDFEVFIKLDLGNYPIHEAKMIGGEFEHFKQCLKTYETSKCRGKFQFLLYVLIKLFYRQIEKECLNCGAWEHSVLKDVSSNRLVDSCNLCGEACYKDGSTFTAGNLYFVTNDELKNLK